jgi:hypothetical protein
MESLAKVLATLFGTQGGGFKALVLLMFLIWAGTEGMSYWAPELAIGASRSERLSERLQQIEDANRHQDVTLRSLQSEYVKATNTMELLDQKFTAELQFMKERNTESSAVIQEALRRHERLLDRTD